MRPIPSRRLTPQPVKIKGTVSEIHRVEAPVKGLSFLGKASVGDQQTATILMNWVLREDRITIRPGTKLVLDKYPTGTRKPIVSLMPFLNNPIHMLAGTNGQIIRSATGALVRGGFTSDDWHWTMFANLNQAKYLILVNGQNGVWAYDGGTTAGFTGIAGTISAANPAVVTVGAGDIGKFADGKTVNITGATGAFAVANGVHVISSVGSPANTFTLAGVNTSAGSGTPAITIETYGSLEKQVVSAPAGSAYCNPENFHVVLAHINRLYFADQSTLAVYYLPLQSKTGALEVLPLNAIFKRGGSIKAIASWTVDAGAGLDDKLVVFTTNGEAAIFTGIDPADEGFGLLGVFKFDAPMSKHCVQNFGGDLWVLTSTGLAPMTTLMKAETEKLNKAEKGVVSHFREHTKHRYLPGWQLTLDNSNGRMICNMPMGANNEYEQMVRFMPDPVWAHWDSLACRSMAWMDDKLFFGTDEGKIYEISDNYLSDDGEVITAEVRCAWSNYKTPGNKHFKMVRVYAQSNGTLVRPYIDIAVNYQDTKPFNQPEVVRPAPATPWGAPWGSPWGRTRHNVSTWGGVGRLGNVGAPHIVVAVNGATYELSGFDVVFEAGIIV